jgi:hypothetical protein
MLDNNTGNKLSNLRDLRELQGKELGEVEARELAELQREFIVSSLNDGFDEYDRCLDGECGGFFGSRVGSFIDHYQGQEVQETDLDNEGENFGMLLMAEKITNGYEKLIYDEEGKRKLSDKQKLFLEFLLGLRSVDLNSRIALVTAKRMVEMDSEGKYFNLEDKAKIMALNIEEPTKDVVTDLKKSSDVVYVLGNEMQRLFGDNPETYWGLVMDALKSDSDLDQAAIQLVSMRYIPEELEMLGMAQSLHWSGWGGNGAYLEQVHKLNDPQLLKHQIAWHGGAGDPEMPHFSKRMGMFGAIITAMKAKEAENVVPVLLRNFGDVEELKVFDGGAGPVARGSANWIGRSLAEKGKKVSITAGEIDGNSIALLAASKGKKPLPDLTDSVVIEKVVRFDANQDWPDIPEDEYHLFVLSVVLHQVMDYRDGENVIADLFARATQATKKGGVIAWGDAGEGAYIQSTVIPYNVSDREGGVPRNLFERIKFDDVAVFTEKRADGHNYFKIPYRIDKLRYATPVSVAEKYGSGIYESNAFVVIELPEYVIKRLDAVRANPAACDSIINEYLEGESTVTVGQIRDEVKNFVGDLLLAV